MISLKFSAQRVSQQTTLWNSQKFLLSSKMAAILNFRQKCKKHKFASISVTMRDRVISLKYLTPTVSQQLLLPILLGKLLA